MDGLTTFPASPSTTLSHEDGRQATLKAPISCSGVGLHGGHPVSVRLLPAPARHGIVCHRADLGVRIPARFDSVVCTRLCTTVGLAERQDARVSTIEHLMAAFAAIGVDNAVIELDGPELPVFDGSAEPWLFLLDCAGIEPSPAPRRTVEVLRTVRVEDGDGFAELRPGPAGFAMALSIEFGAGAIGCQAFSVMLDAHSFRRDLARARTFALKHEIDAMQQAGLARGGSFDNAVVVDGNQVLNPAGLRMADEFVRHKLLDAVGDLALAGAPLQGRFVGHKSGHGLNNRLLRALFADAANWRVSEQDTLLAA